MKEGTQSKFESHLQKKNPKNIALKTNNNVMCGVKLM